jgi:nitrite reductase (NADH) small subunit
MQDVFVARAADLASEGARRIVAHGGREVGVLRAAGRLVAFANHCPHQGGPVCEGMLIHQVEEVLGPDKSYQGMRFDEARLNLVCPWHGWEFDVRTGRTAGDPRFALRRFEVVERDGDVFVRLPASV